MEVSVEGIVKRIRHKNQDTGFTVAVLDTDNGEKVITGTLLSLNEGEFVRIFGNQAIHKNFGEQIKVISYSIEIPKTKKGIIHYLSSNMIKGIGKVYAERIVEAFGEETLNILRETPERLKDVSGIGQKRAGEIIEAIKNTSENEEILIYFGQFGLSPGMILRIHKEYGDECVEKIRENPYSLIEKVKGIGFFRADALALSMGIPEESIWRLEACILHILESESSNHGHIFLLPFQIAEQSKKLINADEERVYPVIRRMINVGKILSGFMKADYLLNLGYSEDQIQRKLNQNSERIEVIFISYLYYAEYGLKKIFETKEMKSNVITGLDSIIARYEIELDIDLSEQQKEAVKNIFIKRFNIITGGPGTGKTTIVKMIVKIMEFVNIKFYLCAPTGKASKRLSQSTQREAMTIHRLLKYQPFQGGFYHNEDNQLDCEAIIIDETSMVDSLLMFQLLRSLKPQTRIVFLGDIHQLLPVGPGSVLRDLVNTRESSVNFLTEIYRQAKGSGIIVNSHIVNKGNIPFTGNENDDFFWIQTNDPEKIANQVLRCYFENVPRKFSMNPFSDIQILSPMKRGSLGTDFFNSAIQERRFGKDIPFFKYKNMKLFVGDRVMQIKNNYDKDVFNGDCGTVFRIYPSKGIVEIDFDNRIIEYLSEELEDITLSYAMTVHKSQGSEFPCVIMVLHTQHYIMLKRNLLYTGMTRAKRLLVLIGPAKAVTMAVNNKETELRNTALGGWLS